jgi:hypothetical protein
MALEWQKAVTVICAILSGCAVTPDQIRQLGPKAQYQFDVDYKSAANCISRQYDNIFQALRTDVRDGDQDIEILVRSNAAAVSVLSIKNTSPTRAELYITNSSINSSGWIKYTDQAVEACKGKKII